MQSQAYAIYTKGAVVQYNLQYTKQGNHIFVNFQFCRGEEG